MLNSYSDWYLPSIEELHKLFQNKDAIGIIENTEYWSSSEYDNNQYTAWMQKTTSFWAGSAKHFGFHVRAIRSF